MNIKETKIAKHLDIGIYKFIWQIILAIVGLVSLWYVLVGRVDKNETNIQVQSLYGQETREIATGHIEATKGEPLSERDLQHSVENLMDDVNELFFDTDLNTDGRILHDKAMAVQELQNTVILEKLDLILNK